MEGSGPSGDNTNMDVALEEAADLRTPIQSTDALSRSILLLSKRYHCKDRRDQGQGFDVDTLVLISLYSVERFLYPRPLEQEDGSEEQKRTAGGGLPSHHDSGTLTHE